MRLFPQKVSHFGKIKKANRAKVLRKPKDIKAEYPGYLIALDTVERFVQGCKRYIITFEDIYTRFSFAWATTSHASKAAQEFFILCQKVFPYSFNFLHILTDNGSEFKKHFSEELKKLHLTHYHTYPKTPKMNAHIERFNRTIQEEFVDYHTGLLVNPEEFNKKLMDYLVWFNTKRVHCAFKNKLSPVQFMLTLPVVQLIQVQSLPLSINIPQECKSGWPYTPPSFLQFFVLK
ncbi:DDE-type integrase/transposase/recombinase [Patescibacteria group bacterium]|nr:DDE-type integrase/transposase/recombinase [Patescibacteria group bacterium]